MVLRRICHGEWTLYAIVVGSGCPLLDFLADDAGDRVGKEKRRMLALLKRVADHGPPRNTEISHRVAPDIWQFSIGSIRVLWFYDKSNTIVISHGFAKKSKKTPSMERKRAQEALKAYDGAKKAETVTIVKE